MSAKSETMIYNPGMDVRVAYPAAISRTNERLSVYTVFWMFVFGSFIGFAVETLFALAKTGQLENRSSMLVSPFNIIYGIGAVALYVGLHKIKDNTLCVFLFGMASGTVVEFIASWAQEAAFGSVSWDYSHLPLHIGGRVSLLFTFFWGVLAVLWIKALQPLFLKGINAIPKRIGNKIAVCLLVFFVLDMAISVIAVARWGTRLDGVPAANMIVTWIDNLFPDAFMERVYYNMTHI